MARQTEFWRRGPITAVLGLMAALAVLAVPASTATSAGLQPDHQSSLTISAFLFEPSTLTISPGDSVTWVNTDGVPHTSTAVSRNMWGAVMDTGQTFTYTFNAPGTYAYFCEIHPAMVGTVNVLSTE